MLSGKGASPLTVGERKGLSANHGFWPLSPDGAIIANKQGQTEVPMAADTRHQRTQHPCLTQFWQNPVERQKSVSEEDIFRAFLVLEANVPRTDSKGNNEDKTGCITGDNETTHDESVLNCAIGQAKNRRSRSTSPRPSKSRLSSAHFTNDTAASASKSAIAERRFSKQLPYSKEIEKMSKQRELEKIYGQNMARKHTYSTNSNLQPTKNSASSLDLKNRSLISKRRNKKYTDKREDGGPFIQLPAENRIEISPKHIIPDNLLNNEPVRNEYGKNTGASMETSTGVAFNRAEPLDLSNKDSTDSEFELPNMPQPTLSRVRLRDRSPNRPTTESKVTNNGFNAYHSQVDNNNSTKSTNNNNSSSNIQNVPNSGRRRNRDKPESAKSEHRQTENTQYIRESDPNTSSEVVSNEEKLEIYLKECLTECSRQRLRAIHMSMRRLGNVDSRITMKDLHQAFQENSVKLSNRVFHLISETFVDHLGIEFERLHRSMMRAQLLTRRDSVEAMLSENLTQKDEKHSEKRDADFLRRLEEQIVLDQTFFDIEELNKSLTGKDKDKTSRISKNDMYKSCSDVHIPLYGALLKNLVNYCDEGYEETVNYVEFMDFLDKSQKSAIENHPEMSALPEKAKQKQMASPLDLMDPDKKSRIVKTLLKKASLSRVNITSAATRLSFQEETGNEQAVPDIPSVSVSTQNEVVDKVEPEELPIDRTRKLFQKVRSSTGFLSSVRGLLAGKKKQDSELVTPIIEVEQASDMTADDSEILATETKIQPALSPEINTITIRVKGKDVTLKKPSGYSMDNASGDLPSERLELEWVYGYRGNDCRSNIYVLASDEIVYFMASIAVLYNIEAHNQRHYREHTEKIKSMAVHPDGVIVATGQVDNKLESVKEAHVRIWRSDTLETLHVLGSDMFEKSVVCMAFRTTTDAEPGEENKEGEEGKTIANKVHGQNQLVAVDTGKEKNIIVFDVDTGEVIAKTKVDTEVICDVDFNPKYPDMFVTIGKEYITWWKVATDTNTLQLLHQPVYENNPKAKFLICLTHNPQGDLITGDSNGNIYIWDNGGNKIKDCIKQAHDGPVFSVLLHQNTLLTGGRDSSVKCWKLGKDVESLQGLEIPKTDGGVRMLQINKDKLLIGTTTNSILSGSISNQGTSLLEGMKLDDVPITQGHYGETRGLAVIGDAKHRGQFVTIGLDGIICVFSADKREPMWKLTMKGSTFNTVDANLTGNMLVFGTKDGQLLVLTILEDHSFQEAFRHKITKDKVTCVKISPDLNSIAVGCGDKGISIYRKQSKDDGTMTWEVQGKCKGQHGCVSAIDWSSETSDGSYFLRSSSASPEQTFWKVDTLEKVNNIDDIQHLCWETNLCTLDLSTIGVWSSTESAESEVNAVDVHPAKTVIAMGDSNGHIRLFKYPACRQGALCHTYEAHPSVHGLRFVGEGKHLVTTGGADASIMQWKLV